MKDNNMKSTFTSRLKIKYLDAVKYIADKEKRPLTNQFELIIEQWLEEEKEKYPEIQEILK